MRKRSGEPVSQLRWGMSFSRFKIEAIRRLRRHRSAVAVLYALEALVKHRNQVFATQVQIGHLLEMNLVTLRSGLVALEHANLIWRPMDGLIELNPRLYWKGSEDERDREVEAWAPEFGNVVDLNEKRTTHG